MNSQQGDRTIAVTLSNATNATIVGSTATGTIVDDDGLTLPGDNPIGNFESAARNPGGIRVKGWALDPDSAGPIGVHVYVNGAFAGQGTANTSRPDVGAFFPGYGDNHGFEFTVPGSGGTVCAYGINTGPGTTNSLLGCRAV